MHNVGVDTEGFSLLLPHDIALIRARGIGAESNTTPGHTSMALEVASIRVHVNLT